MRDEFSEPIRRILAQRAGHVCSNPECRVPTSGPAMEDGRAVSTGIASHITAAAPRGPRYDRLLTSEARASVTNGIWLCRTCSGLVDADPQRYTVYVLRQWRRHAEAAARRALVGPARNSSALIVDRDSFAEQQRQYAAVARALATPISEAVTLKLFQATNRFGKRNQEIATFAATQIGTLRASNAAYVNLNAAFEEMMADLAYWSLATDRVYRFVTTNTSLEKLGPTVWRDEALFRQLVERTRAILANARGSFELWRIFLIHDPSIVDYPANAVAFYNAVEENRRIGARVGVATFASVGDLAEEYADFYCVPRRLVFTIVVPTYLLARFEPRDDRAVVRYYSSLAENLIAEVSEAARAFEWTGGDLQELRARVEALARS